MPGRLAELPLGRLVEAMRRVVPNDVAIDLHTPLEDTTLDSLGLLEMMVHVEELTGRRFDEDAVPTIALDPEYDPSMSVEAIATMLDALAAADTFPASVEEGA